MPGTVKQIIYRSMQNVRSNTSADPGPEKPRGRPRGFDRDAALEAATLLFWRKGYAATSISDLTKAMGIGAPSLYAAFRSKEALYEEALRFYSERYGPLIWRRFRAAETAREAVEAYLIDSAASLPCDVARPEPAGCMVMLSAVGSEGTATLGCQVKAMRESVVGLIEARLDRAAQEGELPHGLDRAALARFVVAVQGGMALQARDGATPAQLAAVAAAAMSGWDALVGGGEGA